MSKKITRREAIKDMFFVGVGLASAGTLMQACASRGGSKAAAGVSFTPMPDAPEGSKVDTRRWDSLRFLAVAAVTAAVWTRRP